MPEITIDNLRVLPTAGPRVPATVRLYGRTPGGFLLNDANHTAVQESSPEQGGPYVKSAVLTANGEGYITDITAHSTTDSPDNPDGARWGLAVMDTNNRFMYWVGGLESFWLEPSPTTVTADDIRANVLGGLPVGTMGDRTVNGNLTVTENLDVGGVITGNGSGITNVGVGTSTGHSAPGSVTIMGDNDADGGGVVDLGTRNITRMRVRNAGDVELFNPLLLSGYATGSLPAAGTAQRLAYDTDKDKPVYDNGSEWISLAVDQSEVVLAHERGLVGDGSTSDYAAMQTLFDNISSAGKFASVGFRNGVYLIDGALQDTSASNSQLVLPKKNGTQLGLKLFGLTPNSNLGVNVSTDGAVIKSTLGAGTGALLGVKTAGTLNRSEISLYLEDLTFRTVANPTISCLDLRYVMVTMLKNIKVDDGEGYNAVTEPTTATSYGLRQPANNVVSQSHMFNVAIAGFYNGLELNELAGGDRIVVVNCYQAVVVPTCHHAIQVSLIELINNTRNFVFTGNLSYLNVVTASFEHTQDVEWYATAADIYDPSSYRRGYIGWHVVEQNVGPTNDLLITGTYEAGLVHLDRPVSPLRAYFTNGTEWGIAHLVTGVATLVAGTVTVTLSGDAVFTDATSYVVTANDTTAANPVRVTRVSGTQFTLTGTGTDVIMFSAFGS